MLDGVRLGEESSAAIAVTSWHDQVYLAWTGTDLHVNLAPSPDGREVIGKQRLAQRSNKRVQSGDRCGAPALCSHQGALIVAWSGTDRHLNVARLQ